MLKLAKYLSDYKWSGILGATTKFLEVIFELLLPSIMVLIINDGVGKKDITYVLQMGGVMLLMACIGYGFAFICQYYASRASQGFGTILRNRVFRHIQKFSFTQLDRFGAVTLTTRLSNDINQLQVWVAMMIRLTTRAPFICVGAIIMTFFLDVRLALILLAATPVLGLIIFVITKKATPLYRAYQKRLDQLATILSENLSGVRVIRAFSTQRKEKKRFQSANNHLMQTGLKIGKLSSFFNPLTSLTLNVVVIVALWFSGIRVEIGNLSQGQTIAFINYAAQILTALLVLSNFIILFTKSLASAERINEILDVVPDIDSKNKQDILMSDASIDFRHVSFGYSNSEERVLNDIDLRIHPNEVVGIVGGTGSGKSTLIHLIPRFYEVAEGAVLVGEHNVKDYDLEQLRRPISMVPQEIQLFSGTIASNLRWGNEQATEDELMEAAKMAQAHEFISALENGYQSRVERGGRNFSGGQRQRLSIARALLAKPEILILDDATSALDFITEANFRKALKESDWIQTVLIVSQRVSAVLHANRIIVMEDGNVVGFDSHEVLMSSCEVYKNIYLSQVEEVVS